MSRTSLAVSLRGLLAVVTVMALVISNVVLVVRTREAESELQQFRDQFGFLKPSGPGEIAAVRLPSDAPLTYQFRVRIPQSEAGSDDWHGDGTRPSWMVNDGRSGGGVAMATHRLAYSTWLPGKQMEPAWYGAVALPPGESVVTVTIAKDPRDDRWKISTLVRGEHTTMRMATVLPKDHVAVFRGSHDVMRAGLTAQSVSSPTDRPLRCLDERWVVGENGVALYGSRAASADQIGVFAEVQNADQPLRTADDFLTSKE